MDPLWNSGGSTAGIPWDFIIEIHRRIYCKWPGTDDNGLMHSVGVLHVHRHMLKNLLATVNWYMSDGESTDATCLIND